MSRHSRCPLSLGVIALVSALCTASPARAGDATQGDSWKPAPYSLGQGLYFPDQGLRIGGYADVHFFDLRGSRADSSLRDVSLFVTKDLGSRWQLFTELATSRTVNVTGAQNGGGSAEVDVERLYADFHATPGMTLRFGKFLTPIGEWNLVHADPLTWTVSRPLSTSTAFARHATGAMAFGTIAVKGRDLDYWVFADDSKNLGIGQDADDAFTDYTGDRSPRNNFLHAFGGRVLYHLAGDSLAVGASYVAYQLEQPKHDYQLTGIDFTWTTRYVELTGEAIYRTGASPLSSERGGFVEAGIPIVSHLYLIGRIERYHTSEPETTTVVRTEAINYRPISGLVLKLEHRNGRGGDIVPAGWLASVSVLF
ncbi:MAG TPA: porin [Luteibacter sp.]|uniref:porin n=1 Tax=Luteibacter sp. TaxID=1886636 RepID=UPI002CE9ABF5|nr:porin [Luteibacter sp.]HVI56000.1 porin [Luteibacter sp.]